MQHMILTIFETDTKADRDKYDKSIIAKIHSLGVTNEK